MEEESKLYYYTVLEY